MNGIQFVTDGKGQKVAVPINIDGLISESHRKEKGVALQKVKAALVKRGRLRD